MNKNEYFSNCYKEIISNKFFHFVVLFLEYIFTLTMQIGIFINEFNFSEKENKSKRFSFLNAFNYIPIYVRLIIILVSLISIIIYYFIFKIFLFKRKYIWKSIIINIYEIFVFRCFFIVLCNLIFSIIRIELLFCGIFLIPVIIIIINNFIKNHLFFFAPHFMIYPYDYYTAFNDIFHLLEKILICISLHSSIKNLNIFLFFIVFVFQLICNLSSIYIFFCKSYLIMNNIFLNKARFSFLLGSLLSNTIIILLGVNNIKINNLFLIIGNLFLFFFIIIQLFYNPYKYVYFDNDENIENIYYYFFIIEHYKNESYILEEKLEKHLSICNKCELCKKLKYYLTNKLNSKNFYKILYKDVNILSKTINKLIHNILIHGEESIKNNTYYIINVIYCYYIYLNKKHYVLSLNLKILFDIINEENTNLIEGHIISTQQILLINDFLFKSSKLLDHLQDIIYENYVRNKAKKFFLLFQSISDLKDKKFMTQLYYNKNEGIINFFRYISICTMIYEEIFNITLSSSGLSLKENQAFLDDLNNKNYQELNQIIIQTDLLNFENRIIYIIGELAKYKDKCLCKLFPHIFRRKQISIIQNKILNSKYIKADTDNNNLNNFFNNNNLNIDNQYINFMFIIFDKDEKLNKFKLIQLELSLIYTLEMTRKILLTGIYSVEKNIIITIDKSSKEQKKEIILNIEDKKDLNNNYDSSNMSNEMIKYRGNEKYYNNKKLIFINKYNINLNVYNIYYINHTEKQKTHINSIIYSIRHSTKKKYI